MALEDLLTRDDLPEDAREVIRAEAAERERAEEALRQSEERSRSFLDSATGPPQGVPHRQEIKI